MSSRHSQIQMILIDLYINKLSVCSQVRLIQKLIDSYSLISSLFLTPLLRISSHCEIVFSCPTVICFSNGPLEAKIIPTFLPMTSTQHELLVLQTVQGPNAGSHYRLFLWPCLVKGPCVKTPSLLYFILRYNKKSAD